MWQPVLMIDGYLMSILGLSMLIPAGYDIYIQHQGNSPFTGSAVVSLFAGIMLFLANKMPVKKITLPQGYLITVVCWLSLTLLASLPFLLSGTFTNFSDAFFEAMSGLTATGATVIADVEKIQPSVLLWRSMLNAMGGIGIVVFAVALLPFLGIGGMQIFQHENSDSDDKFMPKFIYIAKRIICVYLVLLALCIMALYLAGMPAFDAVNHGMTTISTGGLSIKNTSIGYYNSVSVEMVTVFFMLCGALPMTFYVTLWQNRNLRSSRTIQIVAFFKVLAVYIAGTVLLLVFKNDMPLLSALRYGVFNIVSMVTTTGFSSTDYLAWGAWAGTVFLIFSFTGGCTGSTSGSVKIFRWQVFLAYLKKSLIGATEPNRIIPIKLGYLNIETGLVTSIYVFFGAYLLCLAGITLCISLDDLSFGQAFAAAAACMTNSGVGTSEQIGPSGNYAAFSPYVKQSLAAAMLIGRLEVLTVIVIFTRNFWRR